MRIWVCRELNSDTKYVWVCDHEPAGVIVVREIEIADKNATESFIRLARLFESVGDGRGMQQLDTILNAVFQAGKQPA